MNLGQSSREHEWCLNVLNFPIFGCHGNGGWSVTIFSDAVEIVIYINPLLYLT